MVAGGAGIGKNLNVGGQLHVKDETTSTNPTNGAATVAGGVGIGGTLNVDGETRISNKLTVGDDIADGEFVATFINTN